MLQATAALKPALQFLEMTSFNDPIRHVLQLTAVLTVQGLLSALRQAGISCDGTYEITYKLGVRES